MKESTAGTVRETLWCCNSLPIARFTYRLPIVFLRKSDLLSQRPSSIPLLPFCSEYNDHMIGRIVPDTLSHSPGRVPPQPSHMLLQIDLDSSIILRTVLVYILPLALSRSRKAAERCLKTS